jgi:hypothetical protein
MEWEKNKNAKIIYNVIRERTLHSGLISLFVKSVYDVFWNDARGDVRE